MTRHKSDPEGLHAALTGASDRAEFAAHPVERFLETLAELPAELASLSRPA